MRAHVAAKSVDRAPKHRHVVRAVLLDDRKGWVRMSKKIPATTIVLEWSRAETGVGLLLLLEVMGEGQIERIFLWRLGLGQGGGGWVFGLGG